MLAVRSFDASGLSIDCLKRHVFFDGVRISRQAEVGSRSWRHKRGVWTMRAPTTCLEMSKEKQVRLVGWKLGVDPGDTSEVFGQRGLRQLA